jgi:hypothetical protein
MQKNKRVSILISEEEHKYIQEAGINLSKYVRVCIEIHKETFSTHKYAIEKNINMDKKNENMDKSTSEKKPIFNFA